MRSRFSIRLGVFLATGALILATAGAASAAPHGRGGSLGAMTSTPKTLVFETEPVYDYECAVVWIRNDTSAYLTLDDLAFWGRDADDFDICEGQTVEPCFDYIYNVGINETYFLAPGDSCSFALAFYPDETGGHTAVFGSLWTDGYNYFESTTKLNGRAVEGSI